MDSPEAPGNRKQNPWWSKVPPGSGQIALGLAFLAIATRPDIIDHFEKLGLIGAVQLLLLIGSGLIIWGAVLLFLRAYTFLGSRIRRESRLTEDLNAARNQLTWQNSERAQLALEQAKHLWGGTCRRSHTTYSYEDDPVYAQLALDAGLSDIVAHPIVERLNHIRHLSFAYLTFRSATHTRLAHSLGACRNAQVVMRRIFQEGHLYTKRGRVPIRMTERKRNYYTKLAMVTVLLHDLGHGPLSHALDMQIGIAAGKPLKPDRYYSVSYINKWLRSAIVSAGVNPDHVTAIIGGYLHGLSPWMCFVGALVDSPLDVDRMDYLSRDAHMTGLSVGALNMEALIERAFPFKEVDPDGSTNDLPPENCTSVNESSPRV